ncbi:MFS transporter [Pseudonocardiaceae bacterium YIM PH 21723]|nr:MFS transporter [Pseudonocardiaceae bacterium YIM PH 21723]
MVSEISPVGVSTGQFRRLLWSSGIALAGDGIRVVALPLYAAISTGDPVATAVVTAASILPWLFVGVLSGAIVDRAAPRRLLVGMHLLRAFLTALLGIAVATGYAGLVVMAVAAFAITTVETFAEAAGQVVLVAVAGKPDLLRANSILSVVQTSSSTVAGPVLASVLFAWRPEVCFAVDAVCFVVAAVLLRPVTEVRVGDHSRPALLGAEMAEGLRYLLHHRTLRAVVGAVTVIAFAAGSVTALEIIYGLRVLGLTAAQVPFLGAAVAAGTVLGARLAPPASARCGDGPVMVASLVLLAVGFLGLGLVSAPAPAFGLFGLLGVASGCWNVLSATRRQRLTPPELQGRVSNTNRMLAWSLMPLGAAVAGPAAVHWSLHAVFLAAGGLVALTVLVAGRSLSRS